MSFHSFSVEMWNFRRTIFHSFAVTDCCLVIAFGRLLEVIALINQIEKNEIDFNSNSSRNELADCFLNGTFFDLENESLEYLSK